MTDTAVAPYTWAFCRSCGGAGWVGARVDHRHPNCGHRCILCYPPPGYDRTYAVPPLYSFSTGSAGWFSTIWQIRRLRDDKVAMSGRTFGRRHEQRAWEQMQHVARKCGYAD